MMDLGVFAGANKPSQVALLDHFGPEVHPCNVRLEEVLRVEIYRRGLHSDAFAKPNLRPRAPTFPSERTHVARLPSAESVALCGRRGQLATWCRA
jgi:hypothetical protein